MFVKISSIPILQTSRTSSALEKYSFEMGMTLAEPDGEGSEIDFWYSGSFKSASAMYSIQVIAGSSGKDAEFENEDMLNGWEVSV